MTSISVREKKRIRPDRESPYGTRRSDKFEKRLTAGPQGRASSGDNMQTTAPRTTKTLNFTDLLTAIAVVATIIGGLLTL